MKKDFLKIKIITRLFISLLFVGGMTACKLDNLVNPNNPGADLVNNATLGEIRNLVVGIESGMRNGLANYYDGVSVVGREYWRFSGSDPRFTGDLLGKGASTLDNNTFYTTTPYASRYQVVKNTNLLIDALNNTTIVLTDGQKRNALGFAKTIQAHQLLLVLNQQYDNGIRTDVKNPDNLGPFRNLNEALTDIANLLNEAATDLAVGSESSFIFTLSTGFEGFNTPATFLKFNRAVAARVALYRGNYTEVLTLLNQSFFDINGDMNLGVYHIFSTSGGDLTCPLFFPRNSSSETRIAHPSFIADAEGGDTRVANKVSVRADGDDADTDPDPATQDDLSGIYDFWAYKSQSASIPIIRNEELILIYAEANIQTNALGNGTDALNKVRAAAGLGNLANNLTQGQLIDQLLKERRYSLYGEGHRWVDMRRYNRLNQLPIDRANDDVFSKFPRPANEE